MRLYFVVLGLIIVFGAIATAYLGSSSSGNFFVVYVAAFVVGAAFVALGAVLPPSAVAPQAKTAKVAEKVKEETAVPDEKREDKPAAPEIRGGTDYEASTPDRDYKSRDYSAESGEAGASSGQPTDRYVYTTDGRKKKIERPAKKEGPFSIRDIKGISHHKKADMDISRKDNAATNCPQCGSPNEPGARSCSACGYRLAA